MIDLTECPAHMSQGEYSCSLLDMLDAPRPPPDRRPHDGDHSRRDLVEYKRKQLARASGYGDDVYGHVLDIVVRRDHKQCEIVELFRIQDRLACVADKDVTLFLEAINRG